MKTARIAIFLTGMIGLGMGGLMSLTSIQSQQEEAVLSSNETLKTQAQTYVDQFFGVIDAVRSGANPNYVLNQYSVKMIQGIPAEIESSKKDAMNNSATPNTAANANNTNLNNVIKSAPQNIDLAMEDRVITALKAQVSLTDIKLSSYAVGTFEMSDIGNKEGIFIAQPSEVAANGSITKIGVTLIDPTIALTTFLKLNNNKLDRNAYLIGKSGKVLAHTSNAYVGTDLRKADGLRNTIENLFVGAQSGSISSYHAVDGTKEQVAFVRAGTLPFAIGVEQKAIPPVLSMAWVEDQMSSGAARKALGMIFLVMAASLILFSAVSITFNRKIENEIKLNKFQNRSSGASYDNVTQINPNNERSIHPPLNTPSIAPSISAAAKPPIPAANARVQRATEEFVSNRSQINQETRNLAQSNSALAELRAATNANNSIDLNNLGNNHSSRNNGNKIAVHRDYAEELAARVKNCQSAEEIEKILTGLSSEMSESATMFFRYNRRLQNLTLGTIAGNIQVSNNQLLQAYIRKDIEEQVEGFATEGKIASLNNYGPVSKMMIAHLNVAHFEAWAVCSEADVSGSPKLVGVLVILNAGFRSAQSRPVLSRMLRETGNYLYAQTNKIGSRNRSIKPTTTNNSELNA